MAITFGVTVGILFLTTETQKKTGNTENNEAQIIQALDTTKTPITESVAIGNSRPAKSPTITPAGVTAVLLPTPIAKTPTSTPIFSSTPKPSPTLTSTTPTNIPTQTFIQTPPPSPTPSPSPSPTPPEQNNYQIVVISLTSPIKQNTIAKLDIKTAPEAQCDIKVTLPSGSQSTAKGLEPKTADSAGNISWSWRINWNTKPGTATIGLFCSKDGQNFSKTLQVEIAE